jgi:hypothetical protein
MSKDFRIYQDGDRQIIERLSYPRFKGVVTFNGSLSDIEEIEIDEDILDAGDKKSGLANLPKPIIQSINTRDE